MHLKSIGLWLIVIWLLGFGLLVEASAPGNVTLLKEESFSFEDISFEGETIPYSLFRKSYSHLSEEAFNLKLKAALVAPLMFMRSYVNTYYIDTNWTVNKNDLIFCLGDAHPENFGFVKFKNTVNYVFNDLDDSGYCPIQYDILRYFTALSLTLTENVRVQILERTVKAYILQLKKISYGIDLPVHMWDDLNDKRNRLLSKYVEKSRFKKTYDYEKLGNKQKKMWIKSLAEISLLKNISIMDVAIVNRDGGGSGGLKRYWILVKAKSGELDILEMKEMSKPGTSYGSWNIESQDMSSQERLELAKKYIWQQSPDFYHAVKLKGEDFLIRSRVKSSINLNKLDSKSLALLFEIQAQIIANYHKTYFERNIDKLNNLESWILNNVETLYVRYNKTYNFMK